LHTQRVAAACSPGTWPPPPPRLQPVSTAKSPHRGWRSDGGCRPHSTGRVIGQEAGIEEAAAVGRRPRAPWCDTLAEDDDDDDEDLGGAGATDMWVWRKGRLALQDGERAGW
jgi:hypothetical protein